MVKIDLITGFLGSGKTTFLRKYAEYLIKKKNMHIGIIENDYGAINVDMMLLQDLEGDQCELEMVIGGDLECHRRRFKTKLISFGMLGLDRVLVEPSGIYDVDEFFDLLYEEPLTRWFEPGTVISIVNASLDEGLSKESDYLLASQNALAGKIVLSRVQEAKGGDIEKTTDHLSRALSEFQASRVLVPDDILAKDWTELTDQDFEGILESGYVPADYRKMMVDRSSHYQSYFYMDLRPSKEELLSTVNKLFSDPTCGHIIRVKGFVPDKDGWLELNATEKEINLASVSKGQAVIIVIGENMDKEKIDGYWKASFPDLNLSHRH